MMLLMAMVSMFAGDPVPLVAGDSVDVIEHNTYYDNTGRIVFRQYIFWDLVRGQSRVVDYRVIGERRFELGRAGHGWALTWVEKKRIRMVYAARYQASHTQDDPERINRNVWPLKQRRGLRQ